MRILLDCRFAVKHAGHGRYTREFTPEILRVYPEHDWYVLVHTNDQLQWLPSDLSPTIITTGIGHYSVLEQCVLPFIILKHRIDWLWSFHFNIPLLSPCKTIVTIHDTILHKYPNTKSVLRQVVYKTLFYFALLRARNIIAVSQSTKNELQVYYSANLLKKVIVVTEGIQSALYPAKPESVQSFLQKHSLSSQYYLYVGNAKEHKNVSTLITGFLQAAQEGEVLVLTCRDSKLEQQYTNESRVRFIQNLSDTDLACLYTGAFALITATLAEGFCLPVLEARACKIRILASNIPPIIELAHTDDTILFTPTVDGVSEAVKMSRNFTHAVSQFKLLPWSTVAKELPISPIFHG